MPVAMDTIGKFEVIREIGKGATSAVYQAYDPFQNRQVAIKVVFPEALVDERQALPEALHYRGVARGKAVAPAHRRDL
jgi:serine/threonine protein kinase